MMYVGDLQFGGGFEICFSEICCRFFPAMVYLATSKLSITVLGNLGFAVALSMYKVMTKVCVLGTLRAQRSPMRIQSPGTAHGNAIAILTTIWADEMLLLPQQHLRAPLSQIFLGNLRDSELERINDKISQAVVETLLAMTIFREDFTMRCVCSCTEYVRGRGLGTGW
jgi:hypothetical protein